MQMHGKPGHWEQRWGPVRLQYSWVTSLERKILGGFKHVPAIWIGFLDDIFCIRERSEEALLEFVKYLNKFHPSIKFTVNYSRTNIHFMYVNVSKTADRTLNKTYMTNTPMSSNS